MIIGSGLLQLKEYFPYLFEVCFHIEISVAKLINSLANCVMLRRTLWGHLEQRENLKMDCVGIQLSSEADYVHWNLTTNGVFTVNSFYKDFI